MGENSEAWKRAVCMSTATSVLLIPFSSHSLSLSLWHVTSCGTSCPLPWLCGHPARRPGILTPPRTHPRIRLAVKRRFSGRRTRETRRPARGFCFF
jgi:hypothetical protein